MTPDRARPLGGWRSLRALTWIEFKLFLREPLNLTFVLVLPLVMLYVLNGVFGSQRADPRFWEGLGGVDFYTPTYVVLVAATGSVLSLPVHLAGYRELGVLRRFRASALSPVTLIGAHIVVTAAIAAVGGVLLTAVSVAAYHAALPRDWFGLVVAYVLAAVAFAALGAMLGLVLPTARAAQGLGVLLFFAFMMLGGAGPPREVLPAGLGTASDLLPLTYAARLLRGQWFARGWDGPSVAVLLGVLVLSLVVVRWRLHRENSR